MPRVSEGPASVGVAVVVPRTGHAGPRPAASAGGPAWAPLYDKARAMIADGRLEPDALIPPVPDAAMLWSIPGRAARRAYAALERDGLVARCPGCHQWVVLPLASCLAGG